MKKIRTALIIGLSFITIGVYAQNDRNTQKRTNQTNQQDRERIQKAEKTVYQNDYDVPPQVQSDFDRRNPNTEISNLSTNDDGYVIGYEKNGTKYETRYDSQNNWLETREQMTYDNLPSQARRNFMGTEYRNYSIDRVDRVENGNDEYYQLSLENAGTSRNLYLDTEGNVIEDMNENNRYNRNNNTDRGTRDISPGTPGSDRQIYDGNNNMDNNINRDNRVNGNEMNRNSGVRK